MDGTENNHSEWVHLDPEKQTSQIFLLFVHVSFESLDARVSFGISRVGRLGRGNWGEITFKKGKKNIVVKRGRESNGHCWFWWGLDVGIACS